MSKSNYGLYNQRKLYNFTDKERSLNYYVQYMLNRTQKMFKYSNLPDTIPKRNLELLLQNNGFAIWAKNGDDLYVFNGGLGGVPNLYYEPTICVVANPALRISKEYKIDEDCILMRNDSLMLGLLPLMTRYCSQLVESDISLNLASFNSRIITLLSAQDDRTRLSAEKYIKDIIDGKPGIISEQAFLEGIKAQPYGTNINNNIIALLELHKRTFSNLWNEIGVRSNGEGKRESLASEEVTASDGILLPLIDDMLEERENALEKINKMFDTNISVKLDSSWEDIEEDINEELVNEETGNEEIDNNQEEEEDINEQDNT